MEATRLVLMAKAPSDAPSDKWHSWPVVVTQKNSRRVSLGRHCTQYRWTTLTKNVETTRLEDKINYGDQISYYTRLAAAPASEGSASSTIGFPGGAGKNGRFFDGKQVSPHLPSQLTPGNPRANNAL